MLNPLTACSFDGGECGEETHEVNLPLIRALRLHTNVLAGQSLRLTFHDAIGFSPKLFREGKFGYVWLAQNV